MSRLPQRFQLPQGSGHTAQNNFSRQTNDDSDNERSSRGACNYPPSPVALPIRVVSPSPVALPIRVVRPSPVALPVRVAPVLRGPYPAQGIIHPSRPSTSFSPNDPVKDYLGREKMRESEKKRRDSKLYPAARDIITKLREGEPKKRLNILVVGLQGVGKSTLVNSMLMAINRNGYQSIVQRGGCGEGGKSQRGAVTKNIQATPIFKDFKKANYVQRNKTIYLHKVKALEEPEHRFRCQPKFWDIPGFIEAENEKITTILKMILDGKIKEGANLDEILKLEEPILKKAVETKRHTENVIDAVLFVHAATETAPENLTTHLLDAASPNKAGERSVPIFGVITKIDKLSPPYDREKIQSTIKNLGQELQLDGISEWMYATSLYCSEVTPGFLRSDRIDHIMCKIWEAVLSSRPENAHAESKFGLAMPNFFKRGK